MHPADQSIWVERREFRAERWWHGSVLLTGVARIQSLYPPLSAISACKRRLSFAQEAQEIRAKADRDVTVLLAEAQSKGEQVRGQGDAERNRIFAEAFGQDPEFFSFYRSMQAYEAGLRANDTRMLLKPDSNFFRYFGDPSGRSRDGISFSCLRDGEIPPASGCDNRHRSYPFRARARGRAAS
jgi:hypothetical protein